ncbi:hypothetical protein Tco_1327252 [Tanacetum coccineum]
MTNVVSAPPTDPATVDPWVAAPKQHNVSGSSSQPNTNCPSSPIHPFGGENAVRIILGSAGILQAVKLHKIVEIREGSHDYEMPTHEYVRKIIEDASEDDNFTCGRWLSAVQYLAGEEGIAIGCFGDMKTFCKIGKIERL